ncbi:MAG: phosphoglucosamine mutase [Ignavibacteria bacterium]
MKEPIVSISGIRGILGESLTSNNIIKFSRAFANYIGNKRIVIGRDGRLYSDVIEKIIESTLLINGCEVINLSVSPTPTITLAVKTLNAQGGISITASHNLQEWNGMKFINRYGIFLNALEYKEFFKYVNHKSKYPVGNNKIKQVEYYPKFYDYHINKVLNVRSLNVQKIRKRKFKVVLDCVNASGSLILHKFLRKLGCIIIRIDCDGSGVFTRNPEPLPENIIKACKAVKNSKADLGIVVDPDADRLVIINEKGEPLGEEYTIVIVINYILKKATVTKRIAVVNLSTTKAVDDIVKNLKGKLYKTPVGEINVIKKMIKTRAIVGGEGSGGVILPEVHYSRDSLVGIALILSEFAESGLKVSEYKKYLPQYFIVKDKINSDEVNKDKLLSYLSEKFKLLKQNRQDGLRIDFEDSWINLRKSNTEPIIRIIAEAKSKKLAKLLVGNMRLEIEKFSKSPLI